MGAPVNTVAAGGIAVVDVTATLPKMGAPVSEALPGKGTAVTKVTNYGVPVTFEIGGVVTPPVTYAAFDPATLTAVTLSGSNLVATNTGTTSADQGAKVASAGGKSSGKYYFEATWTATASPITSNYGIGIGTTASTYTGMGGSAVTGNITYLSGTVYANGSNANNGVGRWNAGNITGIAVDLDNRKIWFRQAPSGIWNFVGGSNDPATNVGGITIPAGTMVPFVTFGGSGGLANNVLTANFGVSVFSGAVPSGFTSGWQT